MLLKSLEVQGFKTFPDKTKLTFDTGITSVVGPNGSGKSNISDAIRWVLGEQSPKSLRCSKMEDVVFNGTDKRKRQGFAEVTLTIDNSDRFLDFSGDEIQVTRRYYRSGESEYLINKASVRLKDIHELFMDTGLGRDGYSMIGQGKIDSIVASKSEDRREIFEEAAGISRYRYKKTEAERKLVRTEENLVRLRDIVTELEDRVGPLKTQSEKAEQFLAYSEEKRGLEIALWLETINKSSLILKDQEDKIAVCRNQYTDCETVLQNITDETEALFLKNAELTAKMDELRRDITNYESESSSKKSSVSVAKNDILHNKETISRLQNEIDQMERSSADINSQIKEKQNRIQELEQEITARKAKYEETANTLHTINVDSSRSNDVLQDITAKLGELSAKAADFWVTQITSASSIAEANNRISALNFSKEQKNTQLDDLQQMAVSYTTALKQVKDSITQMTNSVSGLELKLASRKSKRDSLKAEADKLMLDAQERARRTKLLEDLERNLEGFSQSVKIVMQNSKNGNLGGIHGPVSRVIHVPSEYTVAMEIALGAAMQNIVTTNENDAKRAIQFLKQKDGGRATFLPMNTIKGRFLNENGLDDCYGFVGVASDLCSCKPEYTGILSSLLGRIVIAEDLNSAAAIAKKYAYRFKVVTLDGQVVNAGGSLTGGSLARKSGLLSRAAEIEKSRKTAEELQQKSEQARLQYQQAETEFAAIEAEILGIQGDIAAAKQEEIKTQTEYNACINEINSVKQTLTEINDELSACGEKIKNLTQQSETAGTALGTINKEIETAEAESGRIAGSRDALTQQRERLSEELQSCRLEIISGEKDIEALTSEIALAKNTEENQTVRKNSLYNEIHAIEEQCKAIEHKISSLLNEVAMLQDCTEKANQGILELDEKKNNYDKHVVELRQTEREKLSEKEKISMELSRLEERKINLQKQYDDIISKLWEEYELTKRQAEENSVPIDNVPEAQKRLNELKQKIKALGNVNVAAIEEYKEVSQRYQFMTTQVTDVEKSKKSIEALIIELTKQMKEVFIENFAEINKNFTITFKELFGGGTASLALSDPENILTSGIDIIVHPPGKIVVHLEALSGGEKALVAIALYFAIMKVRPAPFCVMDEIEAALDDVNVDRFAQYLRRMTNQTQFILITHRRGTMEEADVLYGVTMQDEGISKMLELRTSEAAVKLGIAK